jgi:protein FAM32A
MTEPAFVGGALSFKGDKKKAKKKSKKPKHRLDDLKSRNRDEDGDNVAAGSDLVDDMEDMTDAERKAMKLKRERQREESEKVAQKSHRERIEEFNEKLASLTGKTMTRLFHLFLLKCVDGKEQTVEILLR